MAKNVEDAGLLPKRPLSDPEPTGGGADNTVYRQRLQARYIFEKGIS